MAETGPCGPCSEIFWDKGEPYGEAGGPATEATSATSRCGTSSSCSTTSSPTGERAVAGPAVDTGAGLERMASVLQGVDSVFDTDELRVLVDATSRGGECAPATRKDVSLAHPRRARAT